MRLARELIIGLGLASLVLACAPSIASINADLRKQDDAKIAACRGGRAAVCHEAGYAFESGNFGRPKDSAKALEIWTIGCRGDDYMSCQAMNNAFFAARDKPGGPERAYQAYSELCSSGVAFACSRQAEALRDGKGTAKDAAAAVPLFAKACDSYSLDAPPKDQSATSRATEARAACAYLAVLLRYSEGVKDEAKAAAVEQREKALGAHVDQRLAAQKAENERAAARAAARANATQDADGEAANAPAGKSSRPGGSGQGWGSGMSRDLACADAKLKATSNAGCDNLMSAVGGDSCDCTSMANMWQCTTTVRCR